MLYLYKHLWNQKIGVRNFTDKLAHWFQLYDQILLLDEAHFFARFCFNICILHFIQDTLKVRNLDFNASTQQIRVEQLP